LLNFLFRIADLVLDYINSVFGVHKKALSSIGHALPGAGFRQRCFAPVSKLPGRGQAGATWVFRKPEENKPINVKVCAKEDKPVCTK
jgi:hypothetical protein